MISQYDFSAIEALIATIGIGILLVGVAIGFVLYTISLLIALAIVGGTDKKFGTVFLTAILSSVVGAIPCGCFLSAYFINTRHGMSYGKGILTYLLAGLLPLIALVAAVFLLGFSTDILALFGL